MGKKHSLKAKPERAPKVRELEAKLGDMEKEFLELKTTLQRVQADFENAMKRKDKELFLMEQRGKASILKSFLPVLDSLENALKNSKETGLKQLKDQFIRVFKANGVSVVDTSGKFDHATMECLMRSCDPGKENNAVLEVFQKGYMFNDSILRPAKVKINACEEKIKQKGDSK